MTLNLLHWNLARRLPSSAAATANTPFHVLLVSKERERVEVQKPKPLWENARPGEWTRHIQTTSAFDSDGLERVWHRGGNGIYFYWAWTCPPGYIIPTPPDTGHMKWQSGRSNGAREPTANRKERTSMWQWETFSTFCFQYFSLTRDFKYQLSHDVTGLESFTFPLLRNLVTS